MRATTCWSTVGICDPAHISHSSGASAHDGVERLHRARGRGRELVDRLEDSSPRRAARRRRSPSRRARLARPAGERAIRHVEVVAAARLGAALVPRHAQRLAPLRAAQKLVATTATPDGTGTTSRHALDLPGRRRVDGLHGGAEPRRPRDQRREHAGQLDVHRELRRPVRLGPTVDARQPLAHELPVLGILQRRLCGRREPAGLRHQLAERRLPP